MQTLINIMGNETTVHLLYSLQVRESTMKQTYSFLHIAKAEAVSESVPGVGKTQLAFGALLRRGVCRTISPGSSCEACLRCAPLTTQSPMNS